MAFNVSYIYKAVDKFTGTGAKIQKQVNAIRNEADKVAPAMDKAGAATTRFGDKLKTAGGQLKWFSAGAGAILALSVKQWGDQATAIAQVEQALVSTGNKAGLTIQQLTAEAEKLQWNSLFGDEEIIQKATGTLLRFNNLTGDSFLRAQQLAVDMAARMGGDLQGAATIVGKALNRPTVGIQAMTRAGIQLSASQVELIKNLEESGNIAGAQAIIFKELEKKFAGAGKVAAETGMGPIMQMTKAIGEMQEAIGGLIAPFLIPLAKAVTSVAQAFAGAPQWVKVMAGGLIVLAAVAAPVLITLGLIANAIPMLAAGFGLLTAAIGWSSGALALLKLNLIRTVAWMAATKVSIAGLSAMATTAGTIFRIMWLALMGPIGWIIGGIALLTAGVMLLWKYWDSISATISNAVAAVTDFFTSVGGKLELLKEVTNIFSSKSEVNGTISVDVTAKGAETVSAKSKSAGGVEMPVGINMGG